MKLANNIVRINGYKGNKRSHVDIKVRTFKKDFNWGEGEEIVCIHEDKLVEQGFKLGLDGVTSYNYYNFVGNERMTVKLV